MANIQVREKAKIPEQMNVQIINHCFDAFIAHTSKDNPSDTTLSEDVIFYPYDKLVYRATCTKQNVLLSNGKRSLVQTIKLSNDSFFHPHVDNISGVPSVSEVGERHHSPHFCLLDLAELDKFPSLLAFSKRFLGTNPLEFQMNYNRVESRIHFKAIDTCSDPNRALVVTFEPGHPENPFEDEWFEVEANLPPA